MRPLAVENTRILATVLAVVFVFSGGDAVATEFDMSKLPVSAPNLCLSCHTVDAPAANDREMNVFGLDFLANGRIWDLDLAQLDSDNDGCLNGVEVGDSDGEDRKSVV